MSNPDMPQAKTDLVAAEWNHAVIPTMRRRTSNCSIVKMSTQKVFELIMW